MFCIDPKKTAILGNPLTKIRIFSIIMAEMHCHIPENGRRGAISMAFCNQCGNKVEDGSRFCTSCGAPIDRDAVRAAATAQGQRQSSTNRHVERLITYSDTTAKYKAEDIDANRYVSILAYLHVLVVVPLFAMKESPFTQYHARVGLNLLVLHLAAEIAGSMLHSLIGWIPVIGAIVGVIFGLLNAALWGVSIFGIVSAAKGKARELTVLEPFKLFK
ncbi:MAG: zinc ribbon domain-containing protein [Ruminococcaceae bacterium]|nr:zinc ribbon domain-containing protein [Oscillospiraceae bacterium]